MPSKSQFPAIRQFSKRLSRMCSEWFRVIPSAGAARGTLDYNNDSKWIILDTHILFCFFTLTIYNRHFGENRISFIFYIFVFLCYSVKNFVCLCYINGGRRHLQRLCIFLRGFNVQFKTTYQYVDHAC